MDASANAAADLDLATRRLGKLALGHGPGGRGGGAAGGGDTRAATPAAVAPGGGMWGALPLQVVLGGPAPSLADPAALECFVLALPAFRDAYTAQELVALFQPACAGCLALFLFHAAEVLPAHVPHGVLCALLHDPAAEIVTGPEYAVMGALLRNSCSLYRAVFPNLAKCTMFPAAAQLLLLRLGALLTSPDLAAAMAADRAAAVQFARQYIAEIVCADELALGPMNAHKWTEPADVARAAAAIVENANQWHGHNMLY